MAVPHYAYLKLKMPGNNGTNITICGSFSRSDNCDREFQKIAAKFGIKQEVKTIDFPSEQLTIQNSKEVDSGKKTKKQPDDSAAAVIQITAAENKVSKEGVNSSAAIASVPTETIGTTLAIVDASETIGISAVKDQEKKDPPLT
jgi:hypothetical protein